MTTPKIVASVFIALFLQSCSTANTMNGIMSSWTGADADEVVVQWGPPHEVRASEGRRLYIWNHTTTRTAPQIKIRTTSVSGHTGSSGSTTAGGRATDVNCQRILEIDEKAKVVSWQWNGDGCPYREDGSYAHWRRAAPKHELE